MTKLEMMHAVGTLGQVAVFKALMDELVDRPSIAPLSTPAWGPTSAITVRATIGTGVPVVETLRSLGVTPKCARAIEAVGELAHECGLVLIVGGLAARIAAESWTDGGSTKGRVLDCGIGLVDDGLVKAVVADTPDAIVVLDANLSPIEIYARPLIDMVQRRVLVSGSSMTPRILMSVTDGIAGLPVPTALESVALRVSLDRIPTFLQETEVETRLESLVALDERAEWFSKIWKPAAHRLLNDLRSMNPEEAALVLSVLDAA